jgi:UDP-N-acetylmuramate--alanine ligase
MVGIGGIGMSGIARLLIGRRIRVSGSDLKESKITNDLKGLGADIFTGHSAANLGDADLVVYSSAIREDNPEIQEAKRKRLPLIRRAQALAELMKGEAVITVTGSHGKTTTTSLASWLLSQAGLRPTVAIGGILKGPDNNAYLGDGKFFVAEADESDGSFLYYRPRYSIITNLDYEHMDYYKDLTSEINAFRDFLNNTAQDGCAFCCDDDANLKNILRGYGGRCVLFGLNESAHIYPGNIKMQRLASQFDCFYNDRPSRPLDVEAGLVGSFSLPLAGMHNISNALAVIALGLELGISLEVIKNALANFPGSRRRIEVKFENTDHLLIDDYAHHPTEIKATLAAVKGLKKRVIAIFQPHRYSRTKLLLDEFGKCFGLADEVIITDIYAAAEPAIEGVTGKAICDKIKEHTPDKKPKFLAKEEINDYVLGIIRPEDLIITLGAGDIVKVCDELVERLKSQG